MPRIQSRAMLALAAVLAACQPDGNRPVVSLDQARQVTTDFQGQSFVPPPRTISDIAAILDQQKPDPAKLAAATAAADAQPPAGLSPVELAEFHFRRANAARELGRDQQRRDDARLAYEAGVAAGLQGRELGRFLRQWATAEQHAGNRRLSYELHARAIEVTDSPDLPRLTEVFGARRIDLGLWELPELTAELASPDAALHIGPQHVILEAAATDLAESLLGGTVQILDWYVMFVSRGKTGPFRASGDVHRGADGRVGARVNLVDLGDGGRVVSTCAATFVAA